MSDERDDPFEELSDGETDDGRDPFEELSDGETDADADDDAEVDTPEPSFEEVDVEELDPEDVWSALDDDGPESEVSLGTGAEPVGDPGTAEHVVPKAEYCGRCPYLSEPPEVGCTHEGTTIVAVEDAEHFRVRDCPMIEDGPPGGDG